MEKTGEHLCSEVEHKNLEEVQCWAHAEKRGFPMWAFRMWQKVVLLAAVVDFPLDSYQEVVRFQDRVHTVQHLVGHTLALEGIYCQTHYTLSCGLLAVDILADHTARGKTHFKKHAFLEEMQ